MVGLSLTSAATSSLIFRTSSEPRVTAPSPSTLPPENLYPTLTSSPNPGPTWLPSRAVHWRSSPGWTLAHTPFATLGKWAPRATARRACRHVENSDVCRAEGVIGEMSARGIRRLESELRFSLRIDLPYSRTSRTSYSSTSRMACSCGCESTGRCPSFGPDFLASSSQVHLLYQLQRMLRR